MLQPVPKNRVYENVSLQIREQIENGTWKEGEKIQGELELAKLFQVSRGSIRESIKSLQMLGILDAKSGQGTFVAQNALQKIRDSRLADMLNDADYYDEIIEFRYIIETQAAYIAAKNCTEEDIRFFRENLEKMTECRKNGQIYELNQYGIDFHYHIIGLMHNEIISAVYDSIQHSLQEERTEYWSGHDESDQLQRDLEHAALIDAMEAHDAVQARKIMENHLGHKLRKKEISY